MDRRALRILSRVMTRRPQIGTDELAKVQQLHTAFHESRDDGDFRNFITVVNKQATGISDDESGISDDEWKHINVVILDDDDDENTFTLTLLTAIVLGVAMLDVYSDRYHSFHFHPEVSRLVKTQYPDMLQQVKSHMEKQRGDTKNSTFLSRVLRRVRF